MDNKYPFVDKEDALYWSTRRDELLNQMEVDEAKLAEKLESVYKTEEAKLEREIAAYYAKYGIDGVVEYRTLLQTLSTEDRRLLMEKMDEFAKKYPEYAHLMPIRESIYKLDRLEGLQYSIWLQQLEIGAIEQGEFQEHLETQAQRAANLAADELGFGNNFYAMNAQVVTETVGAAWAQGEDFSERIWSNRQKLATYLTDDLAKGFARGLKYDEMARMLTDRFDNVSKKDAKRLVYTEGTFVFNEAQAQVHEQQFEYYQLDAITDSHTCEVCKGVERVQKSEPARFKDRKPGVNFPPLHPNCRCCYQVVVQDWDDWIEREVARQGGDYIQERDWPDLDYLHSDTIREMEETNKERSIKHKHGGHIDATVNLDYIRSAEYKAKFDGLTGNKNTDNAIYNTAVTILTHRSGTYREDLYLVSSQDGRVVASIVNSKLDKAVYSNKDIRKACEESGPGVLISIHNHPGSSPPSPADFRAAFERDDLMGIVLGHNGNVFVYTHGFIELTDNFYDSEVAKGIKMGMTHDEAIEYALGEMKRLSGIDWREL